MHRPAGYWQGRTLGISMVTDPRARIGIVAALPSEARCLGADDSPPGEVVGLSENVLLIRSGVGRPRAARAAETLLASGVGALVSWGTATALSADLVNGALVLAREIRCRDGAHYPVDEAWRDRLCAVLETDMVCHAGPLAEADTVLTAPADKARLHALTGALIADMESASIAGVACNAGVAFLSVRAVSDHCGVGVPSSARSAVNDVGDVSVARCLARLATRPAELVPLVRLALGFRAARRTLIRVRRRAGCELQF